MTALKAVITYGNQSRSFLVPRGEVSVGAAADNDWVVPFAGVSRHHALARWDQGGLRLFDRDSKNGLRVGDERLGECLLRPGEQVQIGHAVLRLEELRSGDEVVALPIDAQVPTVVDQTPPTTEQILEASGSGEAHAALLLVRALASAGELGARRRAGFLERLRQLLGAEALVSGRKLEHRPLAFGDVVGRLPSDEEADALTSRSTRNVGRWLVAPPLASGRRFLAALFTEPRATKEEWPELVLAFFAERLLEPPLEPDSEPETTSPDDPLRFPEEMIVGRSPAFQHVLSELRGVVHGKISVLLFGESGTGKEPFARLVHLSGRNPGGPFVPINCAAIPAELLEAELFGIDAGVASGVSVREGLFEKAEGGTLFLDEIGEMPFALQVKLLRVLDDGVVRRVGGSKARKVDVRIVSATNRDLDRAVAQGAFRTDLYYRLRGLGCRIPPLRERRQDLPELVQGLVRRITFENDKHLAGVSQRALRLLADYDWPGNVRQLRSELEVAVLCCPEGDVLRSEHFSSGFLATLEGRERREDPNAPRRPDAPETPTDAAPLGATLRAHKDELDRAAVRDALARTGGRVGEAAKLLGLTRHGLRKRMQRLGLG